MCPKTVDKVLAMIITWCVPIQLKELSSQWPGTANPTSLQLGNHLRRMLRLVWHTRPKVFSVGYLWWDETKMNFNEMENMLPDRKLVQLLCRGPEPGGMYFPKNLEFYWGASGDWTWRHFCKKEMHWPRWIKLNTYSPIQATDCHKWTVILWYLHLVQVQLPWENPAMASSFTSTRMDEETSGCSYLEVANSNSEPLLQKSEAFH